MKNCIRILLFVFLASCNGGLKSLEGKWIFTNQTLELKAKDLKGYENQKIPMLSDTQSMHFELEKKIVTIKSDKERIVSVEMVNDSQLKLENAQIDFFINKDTLVLIQINNYNDKPFILESASNDDPIEATQIILKSYYKRAVQ